MNVVKKITLIAKELCESDLMSLLQYMVQESRKEKGCIRYDLFQFAENTKEFVLLEVWESEEDLFEHKLTEHFAKFKAQSPDLIDAKSSVSLVECCV